MNLVLSIEETNKLRAQVGLKLIPVEANSVSKEKSHKNGNIETNVISLSVEETNKLRRQLGLKLIPVEESGDVELENYKKLENQRQHDEAINELRADLDKRKNDLKTKQRLEKGGILDRIDNTTKAKSTELDFDSWLEQVGKEIKNDKVKKLSFKSKDKKKTTPKEQTEDTTPQVTISHDKVAFAKMASNEKEIILTSKDVSVLDDDDSGEDNFENRQLKREEELKKAINAKKTGKLVSLDDGKDETEEPFTYNKEELDSIEEEESKKRKFVSLQIESSDDEDESNHKEYEENSSHNKKISKFMKRDVSKFKKSKKKQSNEGSRKRTFDTELIDKEFKPVSLDMDDENEDDELDEILSNTRHANLLKKRVNYDNEDHAKPPSTGNVIDENLEFLDNFKIPEEPSKEQLPTKEPKITDKSDMDIIPEPKVSSRYKAILESESEKNYNTYGIANVLNALKGQKEPSSKTEVLSNGEVKIVYTDDDGKVLNTKEAFKYLSHKFHGSKKKSL